MEVIKQWSLSLIAAAAVSTLILFIAPSGNAEKSVKAVVGIFVVAAVCSPLAGVFSGEEKLAFAFESDYAFDAVAVDEIYKEQIEKEIKSQIEQAAAEFGLRLTNCEAEISSDESGCIIIHKIVVGIDSGNSVDSDEFIRHIENRLGVTVVAAQPSGKDES